MQCKGILIFAPTQQGYQYQLYIQGMRQSRCSGCTNLQNFGTSPFPPADFEASSTMCTRCFEIQSSPGCSCTRRSKFLTHSLKFPTFPKYVTVLVQILQLIFSKTEEFFLALGENMLTYQCEYCSLFSQRLRNSSSQMTQICPSPPYSLALFVWICLYLVVLVFVFPESNAQQDPSHTKHNLQFFYRSE